MKWRIFICLSFITGITFAQGIDNRRCAWTNTYKLSIEGHVDPGSFKSPSHDSITFSFNQVTKTLLILSSKTRTFTDSVQVCYRLLAVSDSTFSNKSIELYDSMVMFKDYAQTQSLQMAKEQLFETGNVNTTGRLTRGFSLGSNQDVFVNSSLNLTMDGKLSEDLNIQATINDQNIPFQPEGNTAQLQDLDRVFMKIYNDQLSITGGDIVLRNQQTHFLKYYKNVQGALFQSTGLNSKTQLGASVAKGKFASVSIPAREGIQGPYRIPGPNGQKFVVVLANSERVYIDGKLMQRGFDLDYIIDYNLGEITFSSRIIVSQFSRIRVDYEYADTRYSRFILAGGHEQQIGKFKFSINAYSEKDSKNSPNFDLSQEEKLKLSLAGDNLSKAIKESSDSVDYETTRILYKKIKYQNGEIFVHSNNPDSAFWDVVFTRAGLNNGNYRQKISTSNGRVYEWIAPVNGIAQGDHVPYSVIPAPSKKQMVEISGEYAVSEFETVSAVFSVSDNDLNLFSEIDNQNNIGQAFNITSKSKGRTIGSNGWQVESYGGVEYLSADFQSIDRFRRVEFDRDWSYINSQADSVSNDLLLKGGLGFKKDAMNLVYYDVAYRNKAFAVNGFQQTFRLNKELNNFRLISSLFSSNNEVLSDIASWKKIHSDFSYLFSKLRVGYQFNNEENITSKQDSITYSANYFKEHIGYIRTEDWDNGTLDLSYRVRDTRQPYEGSLVSSNYSQTLNISYTHRLSATQELGLVLTYRDLQNKGESIDFGSGTSLTGRLDWVGTFFNKVLKNDLTWSVSNSRELKKEYVFVEVPIGQGNYAWIDYNGDGIMDLDEFNLAVNIDERRYAKIFIPTSEYIDAFENTFNYKFILQFPRSWRKEEGIKWLLSKVSNSTTWTSISRTTDESMESRIFAFIKPVDRNEVLSMRENVRTTWFFNRGNPKYGLSGGYVQNRNLNLLTGGFEENFTGRVNLGRPYSLKLVSNLGKEISESDFLSNRNFTITNRTIKPSFTWQPKPNIRINTGYGFKQRMNVGSGEVIGEKALINELFAEIKITKISKTNIQAMLTFSNVDYTGDTQSPAGYVVLAGLRPGLNMNWSINWQQTLINGLQLSMFYNARKGEQTGLVHSGTVSMSALF